MAVKTVEEYRGLCYSSSLNVAAFVMRYSNINYSLNPNTNPGPDHQFGLFLTAA